MQKAFDGQAIAIDAQLTLTSCWCGINVGVPSNLYRQAHEKGAELHCPLGHVFVFKETENDRLKQQLEEEERRRRMAQERADRERARADHEEQRRIAQKAATTRAKKRHASGVCPACKRTFQNVQRHMASQHPDYDPSA
jgi:hypothetical protein